MILLASRLSSKKTYLQLVDCILCFIDPNSKQQKISLYVIVPDVNKFSITVPCNIVINILSFPGMLDRRF